MLLERSESGSGITNILQPTSLSFYLSSVSQSLDFDSWDGPSQILDSEKLGDVFEQLSTIALRLTNLEFLDIQFYHLERSHHRIDKYALFECPERHKQLRVHLFRGFRTVKRSHRRLRHIAEVRYFKGWRNERHTMRFRLLQRKVKVSIVSFHASLNTET
jgi:hypothetical protein